MAIVNRLTNTGVLQSAGEFDEYTLDTSNQGIVQFNGTTHYLNVPTSSFLNATNTYTIELYMFPLAYPATTNSATLYQITNANITNYGGLSLEFYGTGNIRFQCRPTTGGTNVSITSFNIIPLNSWTHVAVVVNNGYATLFINGVQSGSATVAALDNTQTFCSVGRLTNGNVTSQTYYNGYISNLRIVKNQAVYNNVNILSDLTGTLTGQTNSASPNTKSLYDTTFLSLQDSTLIDNSSTYPVISSANPAIVTNSYVPFDGTYSAVLDGTTQYYTAPYSSSFMVPAGGAFCMEAWVNVTEATAKDCTILSMNWDYGNTNAADFAFYLRNNGGVYPEFAVQNYGTTSPYIFSTTTSNYYIPYNTWTHVAVTRDTSGNWKSFINGVLNNTWYDSSGSRAISPASGNLYIGAPSLTTFGGYFGGFISNLRFINGSIPTAYSTTSNTLGTSVFTPPTTALTAVAGTVLLAFNSSNPTADASGVSTLTPLPTTLTTSNSVIPFASTYSILTGTAGKYLSVLNRSGLQLTTGDFTIEMWIRPNALAAQGIFAKKALAASFASVQIAMQATGRLNIAVSNNLGTAWTINDTASMPVMTINTWYHVAVVRNGNNIQAYVNGTQYINSVVITSATVIFDSGANLTVGANAGVTPTTYFNGYISNVRVVNGTALYTAAFTGSVPTSALTAVSGTSLLVAQSASHLTDNSVMTNTTYLTNIGGATTSTSVVPFPGTTSYLFNGTSQYINLPSTSFLTQPGLTTAPKILQQLTNTYTIELWMNPSAYPATTNYCPLYQISNVNVTNFGYLAVEFYGTGVIRFVVRPYTGGATITLTTTTIVPLSQWTHVAVNVDNGRATIYLNGLVAATSYTSTNIVYPMDGTQSVSSIGRQNNGYVTSQTYYSGYISNLRVVKGIALYPNNFYIFTPSQTPLQATQPADTNIAAITDPSTIGLLMPSLSDISVNALNISGGGITPPTITYRIKPPFLTNTSSSTDGYESIKFSQSVEAINYGSTVNVLDFGTSDYTVEAWVYMTKGSGSQANYEGENRNLRMNGTDDYYTVFDSGAASGTGMYLAMQADSFSIGAPASPYVDSYRFIPYGGISGQQYFQFNTWYHIAVTRSGAVTKAFVNGVRATTYSGDGVLVSYKAVGPASVNYNGTGFILGSSYNLTMKYTFNGYISNVRVVKGKALYTSNFTPSTTPLQIVAGTTILTAQSPSIKDNTGRILLDSNVIVTGGPTTASFSPFSYPSSVTASKQYNNGILQTTNNIDEVTLNSNYNQGSIYFSGSQQYLGITLTDAIAANRWEDYTFECYAYITAANITTARGFFESTATGLLGGGTTYLKAGFGTSQHQFTDGANINTYGAGRPVLNTWYHYALVRKNNILQLFIDGKLLWANPNSSALTGRYITVGGFVSTSNLWQGYISNPRFVKGIAVYSRSMPIISSNITVPTSALSQTSGTLPTTTLLTAQSSTIADNSVYNTPITNLNNVTTTNATIPYAATYSYAFNGTNALSIPYDPKIFDLGISDFTFECWVYPTTIASTNDILTHWGSAGTSEYGNSYRIYIGTSGVLYFQYNLGYSTSLITQTFGFSGGSGASYITANQWNHIAISRSNKVLKAFINGIQTVTTVTGVEQIPASYTVGYVTQGGGAIYIGSSATGLSENFTGYISNLRLVKGLALYTTAFTPSTSALTTTTEKTNLTKVLTAQSSTIVDNSANPIAINQIRSKIKTSNVIVPAGISTSYNITSADNFVQNYLKVPYSTDFEFGTGDFTIEFSIRFQTRASYGKILGLGTITTSTFDPTKTNWMFTASAGTNKYNNRYDLIFITSNGTTLNTYQTVGGADYTGNWYHIIAVRKSGVLNLYSNGRLIYSTPETTNITTVSSPSDLTIGLGAPSSLDDNYMSNLRIIKGQAVYPVSTTISNTVLTTSISPPNSTTSLLTAQSSKIINNSDNPCQILVYGVKTNYSTSPTPSTTVTKYFNGPTVNNSVIPFAGTYSIYANGLGQAILFNAETVDIGPTSYEDFTIEFWMKPDSYLNMTDGTIFSAGARDNGNASYSGASGSGSVSFGISSTGTFDVNISSGFNFHSVSMDDYFYGVNNIWVHVAITRSKSEGLSRLYINGVSVSKSTLINNYKLAGSSYGWWALFGSNYAGYISNFRVVKGTAVYTGGSFTVPTTALTTSTPAISNSVKLLTAKSTVIEDIGNGAPGLPTPIASATYGGYFNGTSQYLTAPANAAFAFGTGNFSIECWVYLTNFPSGGTILSSWTGTASTSAWRLSIGSTSYNNLTFWVSDGTTMTTYEPYIVSNAGGLELNKWCHIVVSRTAGVLTFYSNGIPIRSYSDSTNISVATQPVQINGYNGLNGLISGYISNVRIIKGNTTALYVETPNFTVPTTALTTTSQGASAGQVYLLTAQSSTILDNSPKPVRLTGTGVTAINSVIPFAGTYSYQFSGTTPFLEGWGTTQYYIYGDFTVEAWVRPTSLVSVSGQWGIIDTRGTTGSAPWSMYLQNNGSVYKSTFDYGAGGLLGSTTIPLNQWSHVAWVRSGSWLYSFVNGALDYTYYMGTSAIIPGNGGTSATIGSSKERATGVNDTQGYISNFRFVNGAALYKLRFVVPTSPLATTGTTTSLLTCQNSTFIDNGPGFTITNVGTTQTNTLTNLILTNSGVTTSSTVPFAGTYSYYFNGSSYMTVPYNDINFEWGSLNDYTIEAWIYPTSYTGWSTTISSVDVPTMIFAGNYNSTSCIWSFGINSTGKLFFNTSTASGMLYPSAGTRTVPLNQWTHIAVTITKYGFVYFINGVAEVPTAGAVFEGAITNPTAGSNITIGAGNSAYIRGYISNLRIIKGSALYQYRPNIPYSELTTTSQGATASNVKLLTMQGELQNASLGLNPIDNSNSAREIIAHPSLPYTKNNNIPFAGTYSTAFNGTDNCLITGYSDNFKFNANFTIEFFMKDSSNFNDAGIISYGTRETDTSPVYINGGWELTYDSSSNGGRNRYLVFYVDAPDMVGYTNILYSDIPVTPNVWTHVALVRVGSTVNLYLNGVAAGTQTITSTFSNCDSKYHLKIGTNRSATNFYGTGAYNGGYSPNGIGSSNLGTSGLISNLRIVKGTALYNYGNTSGTTYFTPPTSALTTTSQGATPSQVSLLTCQNSTFVDNSPNNCLMSYLPGVIAEKTFAPFAGTYSYLFWQWPTFRSYGNSYNYIETDGSSDLNVSSSNFCIEAWVYPLSAGQQVSTTSFNPTILELQSFNEYGSPSGTSISLIFNNGGTGLAAVISPWSYQQGGYAALNTNIVPPLYTWSHVALVKNDTTITLYYNGTAVQTLQTWQNLEFSNYLYNKNSIRIGSGSSFYATNFQGYISNVRFVNGESVYNNTSSGGNFTPPTSPLNITQSSGTNTSAITKNETTLLLSSSGFTFNDISVNKNQYRTFGAQSPLLPSTSYQTPFVSEGNYSNYFGATSTYLTVPYNAAWGIPAGGAFCVEAWVNLNALTLGQTICSMNSNYGGTPVGWSFFIDGNGTNAIPQLSFSGTGQGGLYYMFKRYVAGDYSFTQINPNWVHLAITRDSTGAIRSFINGVMNAYYFSALTTGSGQALPTTSGQVFYIGESNNLAAPAFNGWISNFRFVNGSVPTAYATSSTTTGVQIFTPSSTSLTNITDTKLLTCQNSTFIDNSIANAGVPFTITNNTATISQMTPSTPSTTPNITSGATLKKQFKTGELKVLGGFDDYSFTYSVTPSSYSINEGDTVTFTIAAQLLGSGTMYWTNSGTTVASDFSDSTNSGSITITNGVGAFTKTILNDSLTEGSETIIIQLRSGSTSGPIIATSIPVIVNDTSNALATGGQAMAAYPTSVSGTGMVNTGTGTFNWTAPAGVTSVSVVCISGGGTGGPNGGGGGGGGGLAYINNYTVVPGNVYAVVAGAGALYVGATSSGTSYFVSSAVVSVTGGGNGSSTTNGSGGLVQAGTGFQGGSGGTGVATYSGGGGGGAGGYTAAGGAGGSVNGTFPSINGVAGASSTGGGGGGGSSGSGSTSGGSFGVGGPGGGTGLAGTGNNGAGAPATAGSTGTIHGSGGGGGSTSVSTGFPGGTSGTGNVAGFGGNFGGGGGAGDGNANGGSDGGPGAVRIIWATTGTRAYPSTNTGDV